jgi:uncharacterized protein
MGIERNKPLFADSFYFVALLNRADQYHRKVASAATQLREDIVTTDWILMEVADALADSASRRSVPQFIRDLSEDPKVKLVRATEELFERGLQLYQERPDKDWTLTDCISFVVMTEGGITDALTGDRHFEQAGFRALFA